LLTAVTPKKFRDNEKRYRFTLKVSKRRMLDLERVAPMCGFGAKKLLRCMNSAQSDTAGENSRVLFSGDFRMTAKVFGLRWCVGRKNEPSQGAGFRISLWSWARAQ